MCEMSAIKAPAVPGELWRAVWPHEIRHGVRLAPAGSTVVVTDQAVMVLDESGSRAMWCYVEDDSCVLRAWAQHERTIASAERNLREAYKDLADALKDASYPDVDIAGIAEDDAEEAEEAVNAATIALAEVTP